MLKKSTILLNENINKLKKNKQNILLPHIEKHV